MAFAAFSPPSPPPKMNRRFHLAATLAVAAIAALSQPRSASAQRYVEHLIDSTFTNAAALDSASSRDASALGAVPATWEAALLKSRRYYQGGHTEADKDGKSTCLSVPFWKTAIF